ncbi:hypothetical protein [Emcibacter sp. SYSU 3D8]|uniref:DUF883 family protein n=1 Tax=Emcibacter sp. SYSU 3D8 TaxID=3133969 RepID=UPI0031FEAF49
MADATTDDVDTLKKDLRKLQKDWDSLVVSTQQLLREGTRTGMTEAKAEIEALRERLEDLGVILSDRSQQAVDSVRLNVQKQPLTSLGVAFSVGAILALLLGRR